MHRAPAAARFRMFGALAALLLLVPMAHAESARRLILQGNEQFREGQIERASELYDQAIETDPTALEAVFNQAVASYMSGDLEQAQQLLQQVDASPDAGALAGKARFNLGRLLLDRVQQDLGSQATPSIPQLEEAVAQMEDAARLFRSALDIDPSDADAARNLELTRYAARQLREQIEKMKELQKQLQELADDLEQTQQDQQQESDQSEQLADQRQRERQEQGQPSEQSEQQTGQQESDQQDLSERTDEISKRLDDIRSQMPSAPDQQQDDPLQQAADSLEQARQQQEEARQSLERGDADEATRRQQEAAESLQSALEEIRQQQEQSSQDAQSADQQDGAGQESAEDQPVPPPPTEGEGGSQSGQAEHPLDEDLEQSPDDRTATELLDRERRQREAIEQYLRRMQRQRTSPVEKDW